MRPLFLILSVLVIISCVNRPPRYYLSAGKWELAVKPEEYFGFPSGVAVAPGDVIYVTDTTEDRVAYFSCNGSFMGAWGSTGTADGEFRWPYGIAISPHGYVYVTDRINERVQYFTLEGSFVGKWGSSGSGDGEFNGPYGIAVANDGTVYVTDSYLWFAYITTGCKGDGTRYGESGRFSGYASLSKRAGNEPGKRSATQEPRDVYVYEENPPKYRVQYFTSDGSFVGKWEATLNGEVNSFIPFGIAVAPNGDVYVTDLSFPGVRYFTPTGSLKGAWGSKGRGDGEFEDIGGIAVGSDGLVYVTDDELGRIQYFTPEGSFLGQWRIEAPRPGSIVRPKAIAVAPNGYVYVSDYANLLIQYFRPVR
jgi:tripartite motif-containing protein 71